MIIDRKEVIVYVLIGILFCCILFYKYENKIKEVIETQEFPNHINLYPSISITDYEDHTLFQFNKTSCKEINSAINETRFFYCNKE